MLTQTVGGEGQSLQASETILRNLRVLATDQSTETTTDENGKTVVRAFRTVTLEVTPRIAEKIAVAQTIGTLSLSLRSIADNQSELERAIASGEVTVPDGASKEEEEALLKDAMSRPQDGATSFVTGGDVSRFQRSSMPRQGGPAPAPAQAAPQQQVVVQQAPAGQPGVARPSGPVVRVTRGKATSVEAAGQTGRDMTGSTQQGIQSTTTVLPAAQATVR